MIISPTELDWTRYTGLTAQTLKDKATQLARFGGYTFFEHPYKGDEHPILAVRGNTVWNTNDYDLT